MTLSSRDKLQQVIISLLKEGQEVEVPVFGISMFPFLLPGTIVRVKPCRWEELRKGDIIFFESSPKIILHRVVRLSNSNLQCKGDSLLKPDSWIEPSEFLGRVEGYSRLAWGLNHGLRIGTKRSQWLSFNRFSFRLYAALMVGFWRLTGYILFPMAVLWQKMKCQS